MKSKSFLIVVTLLLLTGCTFAPKYIRPEAPVPREWPKGDAYQEVETTTVLPSVQQLRWQEFFPDRKLQSMIGIALENNRDLRLAALKVERLRAWYGIQRAELLPSVDAVGSGSRERLPADLSPSGKATTVEQYSVGLGINGWEIDFFGRIRSLRNQALEQYLASEEAKCGAQIMLVAEIARAYYTLAADREHLKIARATFETQRNTYDLIRRRYDVGLASEIEIRQAQTQVETASREIARYTQLVAQGENLLDLLVGSSVPKDLFPENLEGVTPPKEIAPGTSSEVLLHRPDIMAAEHELKAAHAFIGAARAAFFPRIVLTTAMGTASSELSGLFKGGSGAWSFSPQIVMPIFDPRTWSAYDASKVEREIFLAQYEKAIQ
ncbi:MAG: efflux transporter outer membrane subunit, partial [candidate division WOR-3 bacterium]